MGCTSRWKNSLSEVCRGHVSALPGAGNLAKLNSLWDQARWGRIRNLPALYRAGRRARGSVHQDRRVPVLAFEDVATDGEAKVGAVKRGAIQCASGVWHGTLLYLDSQVVPGLEYKSLFSLDVAWLCRVKLILRHGRAKKE